MLSSFQRGVVIKSRRHQIQRLRTQVSRPPLWTLMNILLPKNTLLSIVTLYKRPAITSKNLFLSLNLRSFLCLFFFCWTLQLHYSKKLAKPQWLIRVMIQFKVEFVFILSYTTKKLHSCNTNNHSSRTNVLIIHAIQLTPLPMLSNFLFEEMTSNC